MSIRMFRPAASLNWYEINIFRKNQTWINFLPPPYVGHTACISQAALSGILWAVCNSNYLCSHQPRLTLRNVTHYAALLPRPAGGAGRTQSRDELDGTFRDIEKDIEHLRLDPEKLVPSQKPSLLWSCTRQAVSHPWQGHPLSSSHLGAVPWKVLCLPSGGQTPFQASSWSLGSFNCSMIHIIGTINRGRPGW